MALSALRYADGLEVNVIATGVGHDVLPLIVSYFLIARVCDRCELLSHIARCHWVLVWPLRSAI